MPTTSPLKVEPMSDNFEIDINLVRQLVDGKIDDDNSERLLKLPKKDIGRFLQYNQVLQEATYIFFG